ncbi:enoyl-CoA-hydratase DpgB [Streptomyces sp. NBC_01276]|uniref:enoyl-CoA-hydratase DpgB n=1 Tax=Streptomyces sp. NBC_01276 TaxID=2903808 RepID=UPI00352ED42C
MRTDGTPRRTADGLALTLDVDGTRPLPELTAALDTACDLLEAARPERLVLLLRLLPAPHHPRSWPGEVDVRDVGRWEKAVHRLERQGALALAVATGPCGGPALDLLLATDFRIAAPDLRLLLPVNDGHFWPGLAVYRLARQLGGARARQIVLWGDALGADRALELGLVDQISADLTEAAHTATVLMGRISDRELAVRRALLLEAPSSEYSEAVGAHLAACDRELRRLAATAARTADGDPDGDPDGRFDGRTDGRLEGDPDGPSDAPGARP